jgi:catechol 2,3-dioxygenase-like lactoylglutathione lyase family enzyme
MKLHHAGLVCASEQNSDAFYCDLLGLTKERSRTLSADLALEIFGVETDLGMIDYVGPEARFEVFISPDWTGPNDPVTHICLEPSNRDEFLKRCETAKADITRIPKGDKTLVFLRDFDGNLFEIK